MKTAVVRPTLATVRTEAEIPLLADSSVQLKSPRHQQLKQRAKKHKWLIAFIGVVLLVGVLICFYTVSVSPQFNQYHILREYQSTLPPENHRPRTILFWNGFFGHKRWGLPEDSFGPSYFRDVFKCPVYRCELTNNHDFLPAVEMFDAVLFHTAQPFQLWNSVPAQRDSHQLYVFALMEPPGETKHVLSDEGGFYNLTMTYRIDSDIVWSYWALSDVESGELIAPAINPAWRQPPISWNDTSVWKLWSLKTKMAAWFVSHCETLSQREKLAAALQEHIEVDIYGKCGTLSCAYKANECDELLDQKYKFYFSFENSLCTDYVTEKLYNALKRQVVPVVFGGADYNRFLPPRSYINAEDFDDAKSLAKYLLHLSTNPQEYMRYFWWREHYHLNYTSPYCDLCEKLHSVAFKQKTQTYHNIEKWWLAEQCRFEAKIKF